MRQSSQSLELQNQDLFFSILQDQLSFKFTKLRAVYLIQIVQKHIPQLLTQQFLLKNAQQLKTIFYQFEVKHKKNTWNILHTFEEFLKLQERLIKKKYTIPIKIPKSENAKNGVNFKNTELDFFQLFLNQMTEIKPLVNEREFRSFIENQIPFSQMQIKRYKQMVVLKQPGGRHTEGTFKKFFNKLTGATQKLFTINSHGIFYTDLSKQEEIEQYIFFSPNFTYEYDIKNSYQVTINASHRKLYLQFDKLTNILLFLCYLKRAMTENEEMSLQRFDSFAPIRENCKAKFYIDGKGYFSDVYEALIKAQRQVYITGWMLSPYFSLKRPDPQGQTTLINVFTILAKRDIKIKIILYMEPKMALNIDSQFTQNLLTDISPNIKVLRHPAFLLVPFLWSHHQKMVIIDQRIGFMGGLDLGYGRMDDNRHLLTDEDQELWPGIDYCNYRKTDILQPRNYKKSSIDRSSFPRMPWHDIAIRIKGNSVIDLCRHFVQYWNYVQFQKGLDQKQLLTYAGFSQNIRQSIHILSIGHDLQKWLREGKDKIMKHIEKKEIKPQKEQKPVGEVQSQNIQKVLQDDLEKQVSGQFNNTIDDQQQNYYQEHIKHQSKIESYTKQIISTCANINSNSRKAVNFSQKLAVQHDKYAFSKVNGKQSHQILRSASIWSIGLEQNQEEKSIYNAYLTLIQNAKQSIYIENQFFISVQNKIGDTIAKRIRKAHEAKQKFKVVIVVPFLPGFEGEPEDPNASVLRIQIHYIYRTLCRGKGSILDQIKDIPYKNYIQFFSLRNHGILQGKPVTQIIYVHSKLMIVDDRIVLIGSANINDRSLLGKRDSQLAIVVQDEQKIQIKIDENTTKQVSKFAHRLRIQIFKQHFGVTNQQQIENFMNEQTWQKRLRLANRNAEIYYEVFGCYPDSKIRTFQDIRNALQRANLKKYTQLKDKIIGHAVTFPTRFLADENLKFRPGQLQYLVPMISFT